MTAYTHRPRAHVAGFTPAYFGPPPRPGLAMDRRVIDQDGH